MICIQCSNGHAENRKWGRGKGLKCNIEDGLNGGRSPKHYEELYLNGMQTYSPVINPERPAAAVRTALNPKETDNVIAILEPPY